VDLEPAEAPAPSHVVLLVVFPNGAYRRFAAEQPRDYLLTVEPSGNPREPCITVTFAGNPEAGGMKVSQAGHPR
jgi:hypothetical protein